MIKMEEIDALRKTAEYLSTQSRQSDVTPDKYEYFRKSLAATEQAIILLLGKYHNQPDCPWCASGTKKILSKLVETGTVGRLECERCGSISLIGWHRV